MTTLRIALSSKKFFDEKCPACGCQNSIRTVDYVRPGNGGTTTIEFMTVCRACDAQYSESIDVVIHDYEVNALDHEMDQEDA